MPQAEVETKYLCAQRVGAALYHAVAFAPHVCQSPRRAAAPRTRRCSAFLSDRRFAFAWRLSQQHSRSAREKRPRVPRHFRASPQTAKCEAQLRHSTCTPSVPRGRQPRGYRAPHHGAAALAEEAAPRRSIAVAACCSRPRSCAPGPRKCGHIGGRGALRERSACAAARAWRPAQNRPLRAVGRWPRLVPSHIRLSGRVSGASAAACRGKWLAAKHYVLLPTPTSAGAIFSGPALAEKPRAAPPRRGKRGPPCGPHFGAAVSFL